MPTQSSLNPTFSMIAMEMSRALAASSTFIKKMDDLRVGVEEVGGDAMRTPSD